VAEILFYALSIAAIGFAVGVISARSPMVSVLALLGTFVCLALVYLLAGFPFLAAAQVLVYAGAIMVLFLFVVMLLNLADIAKVAEHPTRLIGVRRVALAGFSSAVLGLLAVLAARSAPDVPADPAALAQGYDNLQAIAAQLFSRYLLPFEAASLLLLATMVGVIVLAKRQREATGRADASGSLGLGDAHAATASSVRAAQALAEPELEGVSPR
jgi:NADH-quinone oxidoreductase subunit J